MKFGSLFSGIGGFDLGFEQAGLSCSWQVEIDSDCARVLDKHWQGVTRYKDVRDIGKLGSVEVICGGFPCQDLSVAGKRAGLAGERSGLWFEFLRIVGLNSPRWVCIENVPGLLSSWSPVESPPDAVEGREWEVEENSDFEIIVTGLTELGYCIAWRVYDAQYFNVAQRRERVFIIGSLGDGSSAEILFESESVPWNPPTRREAGERVASAVTTGTGKSSGPRNGNGDPLNLLYHENIDGKVYGSDHCPTLRNFQKDAPMIAATLDQRGRGPTDAVMMNLQVTHALRSEGADASEDGTGRGTPLVAYVPHHDEHAGRGASFKPDDCHPSLRGPHGADNTLIAFSSKDHGAEAGEISPTLRSQNFKDSHMNGGGQVAIAFGWNKSDSQTMRVDEETTDALQSAPCSQPAIAFTSRGRSDGAEVETQEDLSYALRDASGGASQGKIAGQFGVRRLTPRECERLQGFPDDWTLYDANGKEISDSARYRMLGNAVPVPVARWIGKRLILFGE